eukprot:TRINITY_DN4436_c0_g2_i1.p1 TRINITY_DN4436_c0_g2~~TRINITY_DN4436_c0_g2_i1.p1  ORF type:complete len:407 (-),score=175.34 TRINITY_DN4436_c0_g2_i1:129-1349(-)
MHVEIKYAQNFVLNFLYNKLPRRRVNLFGEELESALRDKFADHWYPDKPFKGSAFRCLKITDPADPVLNRAARHSGNPILDIIENLPTDLAIWIDPGEVSYRIGEKGSVKILYSEKDGNPFFQGGGPFHQHGSSEDLNPEIAGLLGSDNSLLSGFSSLSISRGKSSNHPSVLAAAASSSPPSPFSSPPNTNNTNNNNSPQQAAPLTYTAGMFAQTKFGSTKLKTSGKKTSRMSPTEFSNYIKTRAALQKQQQHHTTGGVQHAGPPFRGGRFRGNSEDMNSSSYFPPSFNNAPSSNCSSSSSSSYKEAFNTPLGGLPSKAPPSPPSSPSASSWTYASDPETEAFLQDIFSVGLRSSVELPYETRGHSSSGIPPHRGFPSSSSSSSSYKPNPPGGPTDKYQQRILVAN